MISCTEAVRQLWEYLENELEPTDREKVERHLAFCRRCCGELEFAEELQRFMDGAARPDLPDGVAERLNELLDELEEEGAS